MITIDGGVTGAITACYLTVLDGPGGHPDLPTLRLSRFAGGKPIRGTYGDWLMC
jgi:hypothetical protein